ncbi:MAG: type VI secretion system baseplate subunit TssF [Bryobacterales bacterium]|nr:type VI secretion system baseplate subunit TssF [Bryobacterales bacterium]
MRDEVLLYYERELTYIRQMAALFAEKYPKVAGRLVLEPDRCEDPHVERLLEAFAFLAARVHLKIDDDFPEITEALLSIVYPHFIRPLPSMSIVEFELDKDQGKLTTGLKIPRKTDLYSRPVAGVPCKFRTCYDTTLFPLKIVSAEWTTPDRLKPPVKTTDSVAAIRLVVECTSPEVRLSQMEMDKMRFFLNGEGVLVYKLYELLCSKVTRILVRPPAPGPGEKASRVQPVTLPASALEPAGFAEDETLLPQVRRAFSGYLLLQEYFAFPEKFLFLDLKGLDRVWGTGFERKAEIIFLIGRFEGDDRRETLESGVTARTFRMGATPIVNLFEQVAEPILLTQQKFEYPVIPDVRRPYATEVFSIDDVVTINLATQESVRHQPFYAFRHEGAGETQKAFWIANRRRSLKRDDEGTDVFLALFDFSQRPVRPVEDTLTVRVTCTNRDLPARLPFGSETGDFEMESNAPLERIVTLKKPTLPLRPPLGRNVMWRLISHFSLNYLSMVEDGREALQQILRLYNFSNDTSVRKMIEGITSVRSQRHFARVVSEQGIAFTRGLKVDLEFDEQNFVGAGVYLFASVLERFLGMYASLNSFSQLTATTKQRKEGLQTWPPRAGRRILM